VALCNPLSDFSFQLSAFQLFSFCHSVALGGPVQPPFWFQLSAFSISAFAKGWLCAALFLISAFSFQHFSFCPIVALAGFFATSTSSFQFSAFQLLPAPAPAALGAIQPARWSCDSLTHSSDNVCPFLSHAPNRVSRFNAWGNQVG